MTKLGTKNKPCSLPFLGRDALEAQKKEGVRRRECRITARFALVIELLLVFLQLYPFNTCHGYR